MQNNTKASNKPQCLQSKSALGLNQSYVCLIGLKLPVNLCCIGYNEVRTLIGVGSV